MLLFSMLTAALCCKPNIACMHAVHLYWIQVAFKICRFFFDRSDFEKEVALYRDQSLPATLPAMLHATTNDDRTVRSIRGYVFPPFLVLERGMTLHEWMRQPRGFGETLTMVRNLTKFYSCCACIACRRAPAEMHTSLTLLRSLACPTVLSLWLRREV